MYFLHIKYFMLRNILLHNKAIDAIIKLEPRNTFSMGTDRLIHGEPFEQGICKSFDITLWLILSISNWLLVCNGGVDANGSKLIHFPSHTTKIQSSNPKLSHFNILATSHSKHG